MFKDKFGTNIELSVVFLVVYNGIPIYILSVLFECRSWNEAWTWEKGTGEEKESKSWIYYWSTSVQPPVGASILMTMA